MQAQTTVQNRFINSIMQGDCVQVMRQMPANSVDFILTDPPYLVNYRDRSGRSIQNDVNADWLKPAMCEAYRVLKMNRVAVMFYGWTKVDTFFAAWKDAGFQPVGHIVFRKTYSSKSRFLSYQHRLAPGKITVDKIYAVIRQGSRTTINDELKAWRVDKSKPEVPKELLDLWSGTVKRADEVFAQDRECMEAEVAEANRQADELRSENEALRREAESRETRLKEKSDEAENLRLELSASKSEAEKNREIARVNQEAAERASAATRDRAEYAERAAREVAENFAAQRVEHARLESELRHEFRSTSDRQTALIDKVRLDFAQSVAASKELENLLGAARAQSENLCREIDRVNAEVTQLKADLAAARIETEAAADNAMAELWAQIKSPRQNAQGIGPESFRQGEPPFATQS
jgi:tRNA G10  N-methylase Trm11